MSMVARAAPLAIEVRNRGAAELVAIEGQCRFLSNLSRFLSTAAILVQDRSRQSRGPQPYVATFVEIPYLIRYDIMLELSAHLSACVEAWCTATTSISKIRQARLAMTQSSNIHMLANIA